MFIESRVVILRESIIVSHCFYSGVAASLLKFFMLFWSVLSIENILRLNFSISEMNFYVKYIFHISGLN